MFVCLGFAMFGTFIDLKHLLCLGFVISLVEGLSCLVFDSLGYVMSTVCLCMVCYITLTKSKTPGAFKMSSICCVLCLGLVVSSVGPSKFCIVPLKDPEHLIRQPTCHMGFR